MAAKLVPSHLPASRLSPLLRLGQSSCRRREGTLTKQQGNVKPYFCLGYIASQKCSAVILTARKTMFALATWRSSLANILTAASRLLSRKSQSREMVFSCFRGRSAFLGTLFPWLAGSRHGFTGDRKKIPQARRPAGFFVRPGTLSYFASVRNRRFLKNAPATAGPLHQIRWSFQGIRVFRNLGSAEVEHSRTDTTSPGRTCASASRRGFPTGRNTRRNQRAGHDCPAHASE